MATSVVCHSTNENNHIAHFELLFAAETLLSYALWEQNQKGTEDGFTHGEIVRILFNARCEIVFVKHKVKRSIQIHFDTDVSLFARLFGKYRPNDYIIYFGADPSLYLFIRSNCISPVTYINYSYIDEINSSYTYLLLHMI